jgi:ATP-dependent helicase/nuclease subunit A
MPAADFAENKEDKELYADRTILVQGVIDCIVERADGSLALYDYKTDRLTREERDDPTLGRERLREKHKTQLNLYARAVERIFGKKCDAVAVYSLVLGETVDVKE